MNATSAGPRFGYHLLATPRLLWKTRIGVSYDAQPPVVRDGLVYASDQVVIALDIGTGAMRRRLDPLQAGLLALDGSILYSAGESLRAYDLGRDCLLFDVKSPQSITALVAKDDGVWTCDRVGIVRSYSQTGEIHWSHRLRKGTYLGLDMAAAGGTLYIGGNGHAGFGHRSGGRGAEGYVLALDGHSGDVQWMFATDGMIRCAPVIAGDRIYAGDGDSDCRVLYCLAKSPRSRLGECLWRYDLGSLAMRGTFAAGRVFWGDFNGVLHSLDGNSGRLYWKFIAGGPVCDDSPPCVIGDWVFLGSQDGYLYGLDAERGSLRWKYYVMDAAARCAIETDAGGRLDETESWPEDERREWKLYEEQKGREEDAPVQPEDDDDLRYGHLDLRVWHAEEQLYVLTTRGFLHCFEVKHL